MSVYWTIGPLVIPVFSVVLSERTIFGIVEKDVKNWSISHVKL